MNWFNRIKDGITTSTHQKKETPDGLWSKCPKCKTIVTTEEHQELLSVCGNCNYHSRIGSVEYFKILFDCYPELIIKEIEYHDSYLFWQLVKKHTANGMKTTNLSEGHPHRPGVHVFINSPLGKYMDHLKGKRKKDGRSKATDIYYKRNADYWNNK